MLALKESAAASNLVSDPGDGLACTVSDVHHAAFDVRCRTGGPEYRGTAIQPKTLAVQDQFSDSCRVEEDPIKRDHSLLSEKQNIPGPTAAVRSPRSRDRTQ